MIFAAMLLALGVQQSAKLPAERYGLVLLQGRDTTATERVMHDRRALQAEILVPNRARLEVSAQMDSLGCVQGADVQVFPWGSASTATPVQRVNVRLVGDSVRVEASARGTSQSLARSVPNMRFVMAEESIAASSLLLECARNMRSSNTDSVTVPTMAFPNLRARALQLRWHGDSVMIAGSDTSWAFLDRHGVMQRMVIGRDQLEVRRVPVRDLDALVFMANDYAAPAGAPYRAEEVRVPVTSDIVLEGTLTLPMQATAKVPAVVTISGSGAQDRDSFAPIADGWRPFRQFADTLARRGVATLRLDDRGVGGSTGDYASSTERTTATDISAAIAYLRTRPEVDGNRIVVLGHSEGARVAMLVASQDARLAGLVMLSGAADTRAAIRAQALWLAEHRSSGSLSRDSVLARVNRQMDSLSNTLPREVLRWNAAEFAQRIAMPVGIFHGATDRQVASEQADSLGALFRRAGNADVTVRVFADRNHLLVRDANGDFLRYGRLASARLDAEVLGTVTEWIVSSSSAVRAKNR